MGLFIFKDFKWKIPESYVTTLFFKAIFSFCLEEERLYIFLSSEGMTVLLMIINHEIISLFYQCLFILLYI